MKDYKRYLSIGFISGIISSLILSYIPSIYSEIIELLVNKNDKNIIKRNMETVENMILDDKEMIEKTHNDIKQITE